NDKKASGREKVKKDDKITLYLAEETVDKFQKSIDEAKDNGKENPSGVGKVFPEILFENKDVILMNKPAGILSQKASKNDISINEQLIDYCLEKGILTKEQLRLCKPSVCNRLDRNTTGLIGAGITVSGLQFLSELFSSRNLKKYYSTIVKGEMKSPIQKKAYLSKNPRTNQVTIHSTRKRESDSYIETAYEPVLSENGYTLLKVELLTGKPHQIRAHLSYLGYPVLGDEKYGNHKENLYWKKKAGLRHQLLHSEILIFPDLSDGFWDLSDSFRELSCRKFKAPEPEQFKKIRRMIFSEKEA
ncbi:MAG: RluA family pseudouridine synthase, partial [Lachnospiraceae bacterium]|nr:RluA family pseudouridine synthase [Lachnospiraceae bacterium]